MEKASKPMSNKMTAERMDPKAAWVLREEAMASREVGRQQQSSAADTHLHTPSKKKKKKKKLRSTVLKKTA